MGFIPTPGLARKNRIKLHRGSAAERTGPRLTFWGVPATLTAGWLLITCFTGSWTVLAEHWVLSLTMAGGSFIAGATSEGGGAVAFPVMTLLLNIQPHVARDFALMIQSIGMTAASLAIVMSGTRVQWSAIGWAGLGGAIGIIVSLTWISGLAPPALIKLGFVSLWLSFLVALWLINRDRGRHVRQSIELGTPGQRLLFISIGLLGGMVSGLTGSGIDIMTFALLVLFGRLSESIATPTSVILMAGNAAIGFAYQASSRSIDPVAWQYWWACLPIVVWGAPLGAFFIRNRSRLFVVRILYVSILVQFATALVVIPLTQSRIAFVVAIFTTGSLLFCLMAAIGHRRQVFEYPKAQPLRQAA